MVCYLVHCLLFGARRCRAETAVTFAARSSCVGETAIAFARLKCVFLWHCGRAKVSLVSCVSVNELAKAVAVSFGRKKVRPARSKHPKFGVFVLAGRVFSRKGRWRRRAGRVFSRKSRWRGRAGRVFSRQPVLRLSVVGVAVHFRVTAVGVLRHAKPSVGASPACRRLGWRHSPPIGGGAAAT